MKILTTHVGALPPPAGFSNLQSAVDEVVRLQRAAGIDIVNEGELTKGGNWVIYVAERLSGFEPAGTGSVSALMRQSADWTEFADYYDRALQQGTLFEDTKSAPDQVGERRDWQCTGPIGYRGQAALQREIDALKKAAGSGRAFLTATAPASLEPGRKNLFYKTDEAYVAALAQAMRQEYEAIAAAGLMVQVDDAWLAALWDRIGLPMGLEAYRRYCMVRVEALNDALRNIPPAQVRYHLCWGSWHGPHSHDIPLADILDVMLAVRAQTYLFEAANARHEHEYAIWETRRLPDDKILAPGVVTHSTAHVEHPDLVAMRIKRFANLVGRERVIASTDCGLGLRCHRDIAWAKLRALGEGARRASDALWS